jgi:hypothetical protein
VIVSFGSPSLENFRCSVAGTEILPVRYILQKYQSVMMSKMLHVRLNPENGVFNADVTPMIFFRLNNYK